MIFGRISQSVWFASQKDAKIPYTLTAEKEILTKLSKDSKKGLKIIFTSTNHLIFPLNKNKDLHDKTSSHFFYYVYSANLWRHLHIILKIILKTYAYLHIYICALLTYVFIMESLLHREKNKVHRGSNLNI